MLSLLNATLLSVAEDGINRLLQQDPVTLARLAQLQGKVIAVELDSPALILHLLPHNEGLQLQANYAAATDVTLSGRPADFLRLLSSRDKAEAMFGHGIEIRGDSALATRLQQILADTHLDWEAKLGDLIGDLPAHQLARALRWKADSSRRVGHSLLLNLDEYLKEEARLLLSRPEVDGFSEQVEQLREQSERLQARMQRLTARVG